jgi:hypothetical protein
MDFIKLPIMWIPDNDKSELLGLDEPEGELGSININPSHVSSTNYASVAGKSTLRTSDGHTWNIELPLEELHRRLNINLKQKM